MAGVLKKKGITQVRVYFNQAELTAIAKDAEGAGKRRVGLLLQTQKPHGLDGETQANTDGISRFLKHTWTYWKEHQADRLEAAARIARERAALEAEAKKLGVG
jgi:hypothetical protein